MKILVLGASQGTGAWVVSHGLARGHSVTAFARSPEKLKLEHKNLTKVVGDFHNEKSVMDAVAGHDAVVITVSVTKLSAFKENPQYFSQGTSYAIAGMQAHGVRRLVVLSALGVGNSKPLLNPLVRSLMVDLLLKPAFADHVVQEQEVRDSGLDWVIARPSRLTNGEALGKYKATKELVSVPTAIARADVADFMLKACEGDEWLGQAVHLGG